MHKIDHPPEVEFEQTPPYRMKWEKVPCSPRISFQPDEPRYYWSSKEPLACFVSWDRQRKRWYLDIYNSPESPDTDESAIIVAVGSDDEEMKRLGDLLASKWDMAAEKKWKSEECRHCATCCRMGGRHLDPGEVCDVCPQIKGKPK